MAGDEAQGIAPDIWKEMTFKAELDYEFSPFASINDGIAAKRSGELDALVGPITINSQRAQNFLFSQPFFDTEMGILAPVMEQTLWELIKPLFSVNFLIAVVSFLLLLTDGEVDALFYDIVPLEYIANKAPQADFKLSKRNINPVKSKKRIV